MKGGRAAQGRGTRAGRWRSQVPGPEPELGAEVGDGAHGEGETEDMYSAGTYGGHLCRKRTLDLIL